MAGLTAERLKEVLNYDPETGVFTWAKKTCSKVTVGKVAGCVAKFTSGGPYRVIRIDRTLHLAHRLAWLYQTGHWPTHELDHINLDGLDNRFSNLRVATRAQNQRNVGLSKRNTSGVKGVYFDKRDQKWVADIHAGRRVRLGSFKTLEAAKLAYANAADRLHGKFANTGDGV